MPLKIPAHFALLVLILSFPGCKMNEGQLSKLWFYTYSHSSKSGKTTGLSPTSFLNLQRGGDYTSDFGTFDYGTWKLEDKTIKLSSYRNKVLSLPVSFVSVTELKLGGTSDAIDNFDAAPLSPKSEGEDPFSKDSNLWRTPATHKESDSEIKRRLLNHLKYWELYFTWALENTLANIDVRSTPTPIKIYGNGFTLKPFSDLPKEWKAYFFDDDDCRKANDELKYVIEQGKIAWPHTDNKYKMFILAFQQFQKNMKTI